MRYPFVLFDVGETLIGPSGSFGEVYSDSLAGLGMELSPERAETSLRRVWEELERVIPRGTDRYAHFPGGEDEYWLRFSRRTLELASGGPIGEQLAVRALSKLRQAFRDPAAWRVYPDVRPTLDALRNDGVRMGVVSNWDSRLPHVLEALELTAYFEVVGVSHLEGVEKPAPEFFLRVLERLGAGPHEALHVGDVPELDLEGARSAGIDARLVDRRGRLDPGLDPLPDLSPLPGIARGDLGG